MTKGDYLLRFARIKKLVLFWVSSEVLMLKFFVDLASSVFVTSSIMRAFNLVVSPSETPVLLTD